MSMNFTDAVVRAIKADAKNLENRTEENAVTREILVAAGKSENDISFSAVREVVRKALMRSEDLGALKQVLHTLGEKH